jgi:hypothetical protein
MERTDLPSTPDRSVETGTKDGTGASDHDQPYVFGRRPRAVAPWPFTERQYMHLLVLRGRLADAPDPADRLEAHPIDFVDNGVRIASRSDLTKRARQRRAA